MKQLKLNILLALLFASAAMFLAGSKASAVTTYGTLDNFDVINETGGDCHGFEIELEGILPADVVYTFGAPYQRYGDATVVPNSTNTGVIIRYAASYDSNAGIWSATTPYTLPPYLPTQGHSCWTGGVTNPADYYSCGCDHFGASLNSTPTNTTYRWLVEGATLGTLIPFGSNVPLPAPVWNVTPQSSPDPNLPPPPPIVQVAIVPPAPQQYEFGDALWVKIFVTELQNELQANDLNHLVVDDPNVDIVPNEPAEIEIEWVLLQQSTSNSGEQDFGGQAGAGSEAVSRRFEFYKYVGEYDPETHEAVCDNQAIRPDAVGDLIGAQNAAINLAGPLNRPPTANAGPDQPVYVGNTVTLDGSGSYDPDGNLISYSWAFTLKPLGSAATLSDTTAVYPTFTVDKAGTYVISLTVNDGKLSSIVDTVTISTINVAPVANAGPDQSVYVGDTVTLNGSGSSDPDGDLISYSWAFTSAPPGSTATLNNPTLLKPSFTVDKAGTYVISLTVNDGKLSSPIDTVTISTINVAPVANAGPDQSVYVGDTVTLNGSGSSDPDGDLISYSWAFTTKPPGSAATLSNATVVKPTFSVDKAGTYVISLTVNDGKLSSPIDTVTISTINVAPVANAGPDQNVIVGNIVTLNGSGSSDADGNALTYKWSFTTKPSHSKAVLGGATSANPTFTADKAGMYVVSLIVNDGTVNSAPDTVTITAKRGKKK